MLYFTAEQVRCDRCEGPLRVLKTRRKTVYSLPLGPFQAHETLLHCGRCADPPHLPFPGAGRPRPGRFVHELRPHGPYRQGDFLRSRTLQETADELAARNVCISLAEIAYLARPHSKSLSSGRFQVFRHRRTSLWLAGVGFQAADAADEQVLSGHRRGLLHNTHICRCLEAYSSRGAFFSELQSGRIQAACSSSSRRRFFISMMRQQL